VSVLYTGYAMHTIQGLLVPGGGDKRNGMEGINVVGILVGNGGKLKFGIVGMVGKLGI